MLYLSGSCSCQSGPSPWAPFDQGCKARSECHPKQKTILDDFVRVRPCEKASKRQTEITDVITFHLAKDMNNYYSYQRSQFTNMIRSLDKRHVIPSRNDFSQVAIPELYEKPKAQGETELSPMEYYAATTTGLVVQSDNGALHKSDRLLY